MTRAVIYLRISRDPKADGLANERQREDCTQIAERNGWDVVRVYEDTASASKRNVSRMGYERMRRDFDAGAFDVLICWDLDRLTRQPRQLEDWIEAAEDSGLRIITANGEADLSTDGGRMFARIKASVARQEIERKGARQRRKNDQLAAEGLPHRSHRYFGWEPDGITVRQDEAKHLREAACMVLAGDSLRSAVRYFEAEGVRAPRGGAWTHRAMKLALTRHRMAGLLVRGGVVQPVSRIEPILPREQWDELCALLGDPDRETAKGRPSAHWLSGIMICPCESAMAGKAVLGRASADGARAKTMFYVCRSTQRAGYAGSHASINAEIAESAAQSALYFALAARPTAELPEVAELRARLAEVEKQMARAEEAYTLTGSQSSLSLLARLRAERDEAKRDLDVAVGSRGAQRILEAAQRASPAGAPLNVESIAGFSRSFRRLSVDQKRALAKVSIRGRVRKGAGKGAKRILWTTPEGEPLFAE